MNRLQATVLAVHALFWAARAYAQSDMPVYADALESGWENWSWAATASSTQFVHSGAVALSIQAQAWQAAYFHHAALDASQFTNLVFWINGGPQGAQRLLVQGVRSGAAQSATNLPPLQAKTWAQFTIPLSALGLEGTTDFDGFWIQDRSGSTQPAFYLDDIRLVGASQGPPATNAASVTISVDAQRQRQPISPLIYGVAFASASQLRDLNAPLNRSGGNAESRYNWQINAHNRGADWYFESLADDPATPGAAGDDFVSASKSGGADAILTIPMVGWAPKLGANRGKLASFSIAKYGAQSGADYQWFPDAGNGLRASDGKPVTGNDPNDANLPADVSFQQSWVEHLTGRWGQSANGGVRFYFMDNEPSLWQSTHRDVHPIGATMAEIRDKFLAYAAMVKSKDAGATVAAPEEWGWSGYLYSGYDQQAGAANGWSHFPDRTTNGGWEYLPWFLDQTRQEAARAGRRLLDVFTVHYYPQGGEYAGGTSAAMQGLRNRSTRSLWDTNYVDASWIQDKVMLIPRLKQWVASYYPGTRIGITEYNWGAEDQINGATAQADLLGIFGREGLDLATRWTTPAAGTPVFNSIKMYRNYDGTNSSFGDTSVYAGAPDPDNLSAFAAERSSDHALTMMLIHKRLIAATTVTVQLTNFPASGSANLWQLTASNVIARLADVPLTDAGCTVVLPAQSITLLVVAGQTSPHLLVLGPLGDGLLEFQVQGASGRRYAIEQSVDLVGWERMLTNTIVDSSFSFSLRPSGTRERFVRAVSMP